MTDAEILACIVDLNSAYHCGDISRDEWTERVGALLAEREKRLTEYRAEFEESRRDRAAGR